VLPAFPKGSTGAAVPVEIGWLPTFGNLAGTYKAGFYYDTSSAADLKTSINGQPMAISGLPARMDNGRYGGYFNFKQQLTADPRGSDPQRGLFAFLNFLQADPRTATLDRQLTGGFQYHGAFESRPNDDIGLAIGTTHVSSVLSEAQALLNTYTPADAPGYVQKNGELTSELLYGAQLTGWLKAYVDLQYIHNPGSLNNYDGKHADILFSGIHLAVTF